MDRVVTELDTESVASYALLMRHHFDRVIDSYRAHGPVRIKAPSPQESLRVAQMLNRQLICLESLNREGLQVHARGRYLVVVSARAQLEQGALYTLDIDEKFVVPGSKLIH